MAAGALTIPVFLVAQFGPGTLWSERLQAALATTVLFVFGTQFHKATFTQLKSAKESGQAPRSRLDILLDWKVYNGRNDTL